MIRLEEGTAMAETRPSDEDDAPTECNDDPKLTAEEWEYIAAGGSS